MALEEVDRRIIAALAKNPRAGMLALARSVGVARNTAQAHLDRLLASGVITGFGPDVDLARAGYSVAALVTLDIAQGQGSAVVERLEQIDEIVEAAMTTGPSDLLCRVMAHDNDHLLKVINRILDIPGITRTTTALVLSARIKPRLLHLVTDPPD